MLTRFTRAVMVVAATAALTAFLSPAARSTESSLINLESGLNDLIYKLSQSVVTVEATTYLNSGFRGGKAESAVRSLISSGIVYDSSGHVLVAASSVFNSDGIIVKIDNLALPARCLGIDYQTGLALLQVERPVGRSVELTPEYHCAGQMVIAIGNSHGMRASPSIGFCAGARPDGKIQFACSISSGSLGGGLFDLTGRLVGLIVGAIGPQSDAGLAVPAYQISSIVRYLIAQGDRQAGYVGVSTTEIEILPGIEIGTSASFASGSNRPGYVVSHGLIITEIVPSSPAARAGLRKGDLLFDLDREMIGSAERLRSRILSTRPGTIVEFGLIRHNVPLYINVSLGRMSLSEASPSGIVPYGKANSESSGSSLLRREIDSLKRALIRLERRLNGLR